MSDGVRFKQKGDFSRTENFFKKSVKITECRDAVAVAEECIRRLAEATPKDTGLTASSWIYEIENKKGKKTISFSNTNLENGISVAFLLDVGHSTSSGAWIEGKNYIDPAIKEPYNQILKETWKELKRL